MCGIVGVSVGRGCVYITTYEEGEGGNEHFEGPRIYDREDPRSGGGGKAYDGAREVVHRHARGEAKDGSEKDNETIWNRQREGEIPMGGIGRRQKMRHLHRMRHAEGADETGLRDVKTKIEREMA